MSVIRRYRPSAAFMLAVLVGLALLTQACAGVASPKGWASPVGGESLLLAAHRDSLLALEGDTLTTLWEFPADGSDVDVDALYGTPAVSTGTVYLPGYDGKLYALDLETGVPRWTEAFDTEERLIGAVEVAGVALVLIDREHEVAGPGIVDSAGVDLESPRPVGQHGLGSRASVQRCASQNPVL